MAKVYESMGFKVDRPQKGGLVNNIKNDKSEVGVEAPVIRAIVCHDIIPSPPEWGKQIQNLRFEYREYYVRVYYGEVSIGYMDCATADNIKHREDFEKLCNRFAKEFYITLSHYMSF